MTKVGVMVKIITDVYMEGKNIKTHSFQASTLPPNCIHSP